MRTRIRVPETDARAMLRTVKSPDVPCTPSSADSQVAKRRSTRSSSRSASAAAGMSSAPIASAIAARTVQQPFDSGAEGMVVLLWGSRPDPGTGTLDAASVRGALLPRCHKASHVSPRQPVRTRPGLDVSGGGGWCLYRGVLPAAVENAAPWLLRLVSGQPYVEQFFARGWNQSWGTLLACAAPSRDLRRHLRRFLRVRTEDGRILVFRYYDPRVLRAYLPTCTPEEIAAFFGPWVMKRCPITCPRRRKTVIGSGRGPSRSRSRLARRRPSPWTSTSEPFPLASSIRATPIACSSAATC